MAKKREPEMFTLWIPNGFRLGDVTIQKHAKTLLRVEHTDVWVPSFATVRFDRERLPIIDLDVEYLPHERFRCRGVQLRARAGREIAAPALEIPLADLVQEAIERVSYRQVELSDRGMAQFARKIVLDQAAPTSAGAAIEKLAVGDVLRFPIVVVSAYDPSAYETHFGARLRTILGGADHSRRRGATGERVPSHLDVAREYNRARAAGEPTGDAVAIKFSWTRGRAYNAISAARKAGYDLPRTRRGNP
jgi:hypothetical protein